MSEKTDVLIIGGGCAGLATALNLCKDKKFKVILVENKEPGWNKTIRAVEISTIQQMGLEACIYKRFSKFIIRSPLGAQNLIEYKQEFFASINYQELCRILQERALQYGLIFEKKKAVSFEPIPPKPEEPVIVEFSDGSKIQTQVLVDASGYVQWAARQLAIPLSPLLSVCFGELLENCTFDEKEYFHLLTQNSRFGKGGGWFYPLCDTVTSFGYSIIKPNNQSSKNRPYWGYIQAKENFQPYSNWIANSKMIHTQGGIIPVGKIGRFYDHRVLIVGDSAGQAFPWTVEGIRPALVNSHNCAETIKRAFEKNLFSKNNLKSFETQWKKKYGERFWRSASIAELIWDRDDCKTDRDIQRMGLLPEKNLFNLLFENKVNWFQRVYAVAGYWRRKIIKWLK